MLYKNKLAKKRGIEAPTISSIKYYHNVKREDNSIGDYIVVSYLDSKYKEQVINVDTKVDVNALNNSIELNESKDTEIVKLYDVEEQEGYIEKN